MVLKFTLLQAHQLEDLKDELKHVDGELMRLKQAQLDNQDPYGDMEHSVQKKIEGRW